MVYIVPLSIVIAYLVGMLLVGIYTSKRLIRTSEDLILAGRNLGVILVAASLSANNIGGGSTVGVAAKAYGDWGLSAGWYILTAAIAMIPLALVLARLRRSLVWTLPEVIGRRYGTPSYLLTSILQIVSLVCLSAMQVLASGTIIAALTGLPYEVGVVIAGGISTVYTIMGGLWADAFTDLFQWAIIFFGMLAALPFVISNVGGFETMVSKLPPGHFDLFKAGGGTIVSLLIMYIVTFIMGSEMITRAFGAKDEKTAFRGSLLSAVFQGMFAFIPALIGLAALAAFPNIKASDAYATAMLRLAPPWIAGLGLSAILGATMSSADSDMLCASSIFSKDIYQKFIRPKASDREIILITRAGIAVIGGISILIALLRLDIITVNTFAFMLRAAGPFAPFLFGIFREKVSRNAGIVAIIAGSVAGVAWRLMGQPYIGDVVLGSAVSVLAFIVTDKIEKALNRPLAPPLTPR
ncbi:sodium:solute symporter family protein [Desulfurococcus mucosus]|uniref:SSS sodium solute transporter superfamily n=1 Tax=Desulfurococcus mucosus (strain ATCC 35584 / DSM 2162 / JCM 9187 / O7/1) TaxID=765177 RepID=E8R950_DESM0|nr:sodium:solute symporter family protein [Desulfurococcus mucosus]ADV65026.1 SSS sodium solute transporter superfamily [Desulfurococcus mucosus DSM 2162]